MCLCRNGLIRLSLAALPNASVVCLCVCVCLKALGISGFIDYYFYWAKQREIQGFIKKKREIQGKKSYISFIPASFSRNSDMPYMLLKAGLLVDTPLRDQVLSDKMTKICHVMIESLTLYVDLFVLNMFDFDVILELTGCLSFFFRGCRKFAFCD